MDFIERLLGISPDGGDGSTELMYLALLVVVIAAAAWRRHRRSGRYGA
jgi:MYXO-CTERM domain-containing protein